MTIGATNLALEAGKAVAANAVMIGAVAAVEGFPLSKELLLEKLKENVPPKFLDLNLKAFDLGFEYMKNRA
jgi:indolepyruvate ferredoxin oxidoreductase beta subunit